jgi:hypothetical protein
VLGNQTNAGMTARQASEGIDAAAKAIERFERTEAIQLRATIWNAETTSVAMARTASA